MGLARGLRSLVSFLTRIPTGSHDLDSASSHFYLAPLVGFLEGALIGVVIGLMALAGVEGLVAGGAYTLLHIIVTGGLHLDGLADYCDVIGSGARGRRVLEVLKDPNRGSFAVIGVAANLASSSLFAASLYEALALSHSTVFTLLMATCYATAVEAAYIALWLSPEIPVEGLGRLFKSRMNRRKNIANIALYSFLLLSSIYTVTLLTPSSAIVLVAGVAPSLLTPILVVRDAEHRLGYVNGDVAGFTIETSRLVFLAFASIPLGILV